MLEVAAVFGLRNQKPKAHSDIQRQVALVPLASDRSPEDREVLCVVDREDS